ncbi:hypothetical protein RUM44_006789 [Polyplax serrata]|uniref:SH3 domain-containing protein n=1 Tax=Polyplax serrata TaxID=468196 RepID=A0ABR1AJ62_POLSC
MAMFPIRAPLHGQFEIRNIRHIPKAKATTVAETPEFRRIAENTKIQSNVKYHEDFEKTKGKFTQVADDPETLRIKANSKNISNVAYHGELEKKAVMEKLRNIGENGHNEGIAGDSNSQHTDRNHGIQHKQSYQEPQTNSSYPIRQSQTVIYTSDRGPVSNPPDRRIGSIHDLDPVNEFYGSLGDHSGKGSSSDVYARNYSPQHNEYQQQPKYQQQQTNYSYSSNQTQQYSRNISNNHQRSSGPSMGYSNDYPSNSVPDTQQGQPVRQQVRNSGRVFRAMYDYKAQDTDEVSFMNGDLIVNCTPIDDGWLIGVVKRTGQSGMVPANYVTPAI